jgi:2-polyprenyl-3-methyl-5-hydroxy-6-metoxy-1,4-benzoquinol methylase
LGSLFHGKTSTGGGKQNEIKSMTTKVGSTFIFNDTDHSVNALYLKHKKSFLDKFELCLTEVSSSNLRSMKAHQKVGFETIYSFDYQIDNSPENIVTETSISDADEMDVSYLFRTFDDMPKIEQKALQLCNGKILDVGCGAGCHSLCLQENGFDLTAIDISENAVKACTLRGLKNAKVQDVLDLDSDKNKFDTILLLMNGTGIFQTIAETPIYLKKLNNLLNPNGQILIDSSDIIYMYDDEDLDELTNYYGELAFTITYKNQTEKSFPWLYLDFETLKKLASESDLNCELIEKGEHFDYLARVF